MLMTKTVETVTNISSLTSVTNIDVGLQIPIILKANFRFIRLQSSQIDSQFSGLVHKLCIGYFIIIHIEANNSSTTHVNLLRLSANNGFKLWKFSTWKRSRRNMTVKHFWLNMPSVSVTVKGSYHNKYAFCQIVLAYTQAAVQYFP